MSAVDFLIVGLVALSVFIGLVRGFMREAVSLAAWVLAVWVALRFDWVVMPWLEALNARPELQLWSARVILFVGVLLAGTLVNYVLSLLVRGTGLTGTDRTLGMVFGFGRGVLVVGLLVMLGQYAGMQSESWWQQSQLIPHGERVANTIRELAEEAIQDFGNPDTVQN